MQPHLHILQFSPTTQGTRVITASSDKSCRLWDTESGECLQVRIMKGTGLLRICWAQLSGDVKGTRRQRTGRWVRVTLGPQQPLNTQVAHHTCLTLPFTHSHSLSHSQILEGHTDEIFSCAFNYEGDFIITGSKDNTCRIWKAETATSQVGWAVVLSCCHSFLACLAR